MQTVLITGASSGIGRASAELFASSGWNVVATMRTPNADSTETTLVTRLDVADPSSIAAAVDAAIERFGQIDVVVNNAGYGQYGAFESVPPEAVRAQFDVNVFGVMDVIRCVLPHLRARSGGTIINVSSGAGLYGLPMSSLYCASKFALEGFSEAVSYELGALGIAVKLVIPHGGVGGTEFPGNTAAKNAPTRPEYEPFTRQLADAGARMPAPRMIPAHDVAQVIFAAATDGTDQLRYLVGNDTRGFIAAWDTLPSAEYVAFMRAKFGPARG
jgi:NAD(P)-dependent dehydrogenase (short-subunit alcohol dehydrogenase family)